MTSIPFVIDNQQHNMAGVAAAYFNVGNWLVTTLNQGLTPPGIPAHLDEEPTCALQWKGVPFTSFEEQVIHALLHL